MTTLNIYQDIECIAFKMSYPINRQATCVANARHDTNVLIQAARLSKGLTLSELSVLTKINEETLRRYEKGVETPDICAMKILEMRLDAPQPDAMSVDVSVFDPMGRPAPATCPLRIPRRRDKTGFSGWPAHQILAT